MTQQTTRTPSPFTVQERTLIRYEFCRRFGQDPSVADGIFLRTWRGGERAGQPKIPPAIRSMAERGLLEIQADHKPWPRAAFTRAGIEALRQLVADRRAMDPERFAHLRRELGVDAGEEIG